VIIFHRIFGKFSLCIQFSKNPIPSLHTIYSPLQDLKHWFEDVQDRFPG